MNNFKPTSAATPNRRPVLKMIFATMGLMMLSAVPAMAGDLAPGRYAIESATFAGKLLRGLPEQGNELVTASNPQATVFLVTAEKEDTYSLQSHAFFVSVNGDHGVAMHKANGTREKFKVVKNADATYSFQAVWCGKYISVDKDGKVDSSKDPGDNVKFKLLKK